MVACAAKSVNRQICLSERLHLFAAQSNNPDYLIVFEQRHNQAGSNTCVVAFKCREVGDVDR